MKNLIVFRKTVETGVDPRQQKPRVASSKAYAYNCSIFLWEFFIVFKPF